MTIELVFRPLIAGLLGAIIGLDRAYRAKEAGFRTHFLVCLGSALFMVVSQLRIFRRFTRRYHSLRPRTHSSTSGKRYRIHWCRHHHYTPTICARVDHCSRLVGNVGHRSGHRRRSILVGHRCYGLHTPRPGIAHHSVQENRHSQLQHQILDWNLWEYSQDNWDDTPTRGTHHLIRSRRAHHW